MKSSNALEIFIGKSNYGTVPSQTPFSNKSYEMPLFEARYLSIRVRANEFRRKAGNSHVVGFEFQMKSSQPDIVEMQKDLSMPSSFADGTHPDAVLIQDLYICKYKKQGRQCLSVQLETRVCKHRIGQH